MTFDFTGRTAIVTGAAHGFGRAISIAFAARGGEDDVLSGDRGEPVKFRPMCQWPFFFLLARSDVADDGAFIRQNFFGRVRERGVGADFGF